MGGIRGRVGAIACAAAMVVTFSACGRGGSDRVVLVDHTHDEFASFFMANFPRQVTAAPGDKVVFRQTWTGEPHTVTGGTLVDEVMTKLRNFVPFFEAYDGLLIRGVDIPREPGDETLASVLRAIDRSGEEPQRTAFFDTYDALVQEGTKLPPRDQPGRAKFADVLGTIDGLANDAFVTSEGDLDFAIDDADDDGGLGIKQNIGQPCYLKEGLPPKDRGTPCKESQQQQPVFDGTASYYNSGIIPYEGPNGNRYEVQLAPDLESGSYFFYCAVHGPNQRTEVKVVGDAEDAPAAADTNKQALAEIAEGSEPLVAARHDARDGEVTVDGEKIRGPFAGLGSASLGAVNEFLPKKLRVEAGEQITWSVMGPDHTISFDVPKYFPIVAFAENGEVTLNPKIEPPAGGSPDIPDTDELLRIDGGTYDGDGFFSSGLIGGEPYAQYSLRISEPGTYAYACLVHPPMVGTIEVTPRE